MKTVRLSRQLKWDIAAAADKKFKNANPTRAYPNDGYAVLEQEGIIDKIESTKKMWQSIWNKPLPTTTVDEVQIIAKWTSPENIDEAGIDRGSREENRTYTLTIPDMEAPEAITRYDSIRISVDHTSETMQECISVNDYNNKLDKTKRDQRWKLEEVMERFSTLNQLLKAAPYVKDLVPQEKLTKMHEVDDRSGRQKELAEVADSELQDLRETLLEDALLGDD